MGTSLWKAGRESSRCGLLAACAVHRASHTTRWVAPFEDFIHVFRCSSVEIFGLSSTEDESACLWIEAEELPGLDAERRGRAPKSIHGPEGREHASRAKSPSAWCRKNCR